MTTTIVGKGAQEIEPILAQHGFTLTTHEPDFVVSYGGDGMLMQAEHRWPGVPKILLKKSAICKLCSKLPNEEVLLRIARGDYDVKTLMKLEARVNGKILTGMNDITVHNADARHAIRYRLTVNGKRVSDEIIGDGIVVATPLGSTGYYRSITDSFFSIGIGLAFNNSTEQSDHMVLDDGSTIELTVLRGPAIVYADNQEDLIPLAEGGTVTIVKSPNTARIVSVRE